MVLPPPIPHAEPAAKKPKHAHWPRFPIYKDKRLVGQICWDEEGRSLNAECGLHADCRINRTVNAHASRSGQGRPLAFLVQWLWMGCDPDITTAVYHNVLQEKISLPQREEARKWIMEEATMKFPRERERPPGLDEPDEPREGKHFLVKRRDGVCLKDYEPDWAPGMV